MAEQAELDGELDDELERVLDALATPRERALQAGGSARLQVTAQPVRAPIVMAVPLPLGMREQLVACTASLTT